MQKEKKKRELGHPLTFFLLRSRKEGRREKKTERKQKGREEKGVTYIKR